MNELVITEAGAGAHHAIAGAQWTWKVRPEQADGAFCFFEMTLEPGQGVPSHRHGYPEALYVLEGSIQVHGSGIDAAPTLCSVGGVVLAGPGTSHSFVNAGPGTARLLSLSSGAHARFFDAVVEADRNRAFSDLPPPEAFARVVEIGARTDTLFDPAPQPDAA